MVQAELGFRPVPVQGGVRRRESPAKPVRLFLSKMQRTDRHHYHHSYGDGFLFALIH